GVYADSKSTVSARDSGFAYNGSYGVIGNAVPGDITEVTLVRNSVLGSVAGYRVAASGTGQTLMFVDANQCVGCFFMFSFAGGTGTEAVLSAGNNSPLNSSPVENGTLSPLATPFI
ncbi:MAG TPA: hypothetical protein VJ891_16195, partial [Casimicrobiaceae bacterium]|nr:hypothetical protein [Casimicrobiaceae bacterium]